MEESQGYRKISSRIFKKKSNRKRINKFMYNVKSVSFFIYAFFCNRKSHFIFWKSFFLSLYLFVLLKTWNIEMHFKFYKNFSRKRLFKLHSSLIYKYSLKYKYFEIIIIQNYYYYYFTYLCEGYSIIIKTAPQNTWKDFVWNVKVTNI